VLAHIRHLRRAENVRDIVEAGMQALACQRLQFDRLGHCRLDDAPQLHRHSAARLPHEDDLSLAFDDIDRAAALAGDSLGLGLRRRRPPKR